LKLSFTVYLLSCVFVFIKVRLLFPCISHVLDFRRTVDFDKSFHNQLF